MENQDQAPSQPDLPPNPNPPVNNSNPEEKHWPLHLHLKGVWLIIAAVIAFLAIISYAGLHSGSHNNAPKPNNSAQAAKTQAVVTITPTGFLPSTISVSPGTQVSWKNTDTIPHQVAADPYPKNNSIPGFDSTQVLAPNDSYSFSFTKAGTYTYHDQLNPFKLLGTVVVR